MIKLFSKIALYGIGIAVLFSHIAIAATIKQLVAGEGRAAVVMNPDEQSQQTPYFLATINGRQCRLPVVKRKEAIVIVSTKDCPFEKDLVVGLTVEVPLIAEPAPEKPLAQSEPDQKTMPTPKETPGYERNLTDISYIPFRGQSAVSALYATASLEGSADFKGSNVSKFDEKLSAITLSYAYGLSDSFSLLLTESFLLEDETNYKYGPASSSNGQKKKYISEGAGDPGVGFGLRALEQSEKSAFNIDLMLVYLTSFQKAKAATPTEKGNAAIGGDGFIGAVALSRKIEAFSFLVQFAYESLNKRTETADSVDTETTGGNRTSMGIAGQFQANDSFLMKTSLIQTYTAAKESVTGNSKTSMDNLTTTKIGLDFDISIVPDSMIWVIGMTRVEPQNTEITSAGSVIDYSENGYTEYHTGFRFAF